MKPPPGCGGAVPAGQKAYRFRVDTFGFRKNYIEYANSPAEALRKMKAYLGTIKRPSVISSWCRIT